MASRSVKPFSPSERVLRIINILTIFPGLAFLVATGISRGDWYWGEVEVWPMVGLAPLVLSGILGILVLWLQPARFRVLVIMADLGLAGFTLGIDIWGWARGHHAGMIGGHAASALLVDFFIHSFFVLREIWYLANLRELFRFARLGGSSCTKCPHCLNEARAKKTSVKAVGSKETYHRVPGREDEYDEDVDGAGSYSDARPSMDDVSARLV